MAELENWRYDTVSDQTIRELLDRSHQVTHAMPDISGQSRTNYKQPLQFHSDFDW